eukprot:2115893-Alexandrium_andersonii.AAC.1
MWRCDIRTLGHMDLGTWSHAASKSVKKVRRRATRASGRLGVGKGGGDNRGARRMSGGQEAWKEAT